MVRGKATSISLTDPQNSYSGTKVNDTWHPSVTLYPNLPQEAPSEDTQEGNYGSMIMLKMKVFAHWSAQSLQLEYSV